ncbi:hypothetical protein [Nocardia wallacei]|uniref:hypothetical protein n=1 Tax=Nocardia wallacei TaxID=480035 RepID=UPI0024571B9D|nr:hypothetical protein [Nocardia wallacei]
MPQHSDSAPSTHDTTINQLPGQETRSFRKLWQLGEFGLNALITGITTRMSA